MTKASNWKQKFIHTVWEVICLQFEFCIKRGSYRVEFHRRLCSTTKSYSLYCNMSTAEIFPPCRSRLPVSHSRLMSERASAQHTATPSPCTCRSRKPKVVHDVRRKAGNLLVLELEVAKSS